MAQTTTAVESVSLSVENIGGITETNVELAPGVTVLTGRNATNRTSLLQAIMTALGSDDATVKGDADEGRVELAIGDDTYTRRLSRQNGTHVVDGDPYLEDATLADLFAFLLETNDARQAVARGEDLRQVIMEPVDTDEIEAEIDRLQSRRADIDERIDEVDRLRENLPALEQERTSLQDQIETKRTELVDVRERIEDIDADVDEKRDEKEALEGKLDELNDVRSELETVRRQLDTQQDSLEALREERAELERDSEEYEGIPDGRVEGIEAEIQRLRDRKDDLDGSITELQTVVEFNEDLLDGNLDVFDDLQNEGGDDDITDRLLADDDEVVCWTCGSHTDTGQIETMLDTLRDLRDRYMDERGDLDAEIDELTDQRRRLRERRRQRTQIDDQLEAIADEIDQRESRTEELTGRRDELTDRVEALEADVEELRTDDDRDSELLDHHKEANRLEVEIERLEADLADVEDDIARIEDRVGEREELESRREELNEEIEDLRTRVERLEEGAITQFNDHMESVLDILDYENLERIWIERTEERVREGRQTVTKGRFDLHIVRRTDDGTVYEDTVDHLSESEREVTGLVFALAGYLVHDVYEEVPFILMDSVEAIDAPRLADLVDYFRAHAEYLVVALLHEDAQALDEDYPRVTDI